MNKSEAIKAIKDGKKVIKINQANELDWYRYSVEDFFYVISEDDYFYYIYFNKYEENYITKKDCTIITLDMLENNSDLTWKNIQGKKMAINCQTQNEFVQVNQIMKGSYISQDWIDYREDSCFSCATTTLKSKLFFKNIDFSIVSASDFISANNSTEKLEHEENKHHLKQGMNNDCMPSDFDEASLLNMKSNLAMGIAEGVNILYEEEFVHGDLHHYPYIDKQKLASEIQHLIDVEKIKYAVEFAEWIAFNKWKYLKSCCKWTDITDTSLISTAQLLDIFNDKKHVIN